MFVGIVVIGVLGLITAVLFQELENLVIPWKSN
jgi:ABC-type nitrate/sulfonate/bicarbonate transport system permease component